MDLFGNKKRARTELILQLVEYELYTIANTSFETLNKKIDALEIFCLSLWLVRQAAAEAYGAVYAHKLFFELQPACANLAFNFISPPDPDWRESLHNRIEETANVYRATVIDDLQAYAPNGHSVGLEQLSGTAATFCGFTCNNINTAETEKFSHWLSYYLYDQLLSYLRNFKSDSKPNFDLDVARSAWRTNSQLLDERKRRVAVFEGEVDSVEKLVAKGKERGYVTYDDLNGALPPGEVSSEQIEDTMALLSEMDVSVVENDEVDSEVSSMIEKRLERLQNLVEQDLITEDEAAKKRIEILEGL